MAVINDYVSTLIGKGRAKPLNTGMYTNRAVISFEVAATDDILSKYRLMRLPSDAIILDVKIANDAIAGLTDMNLGFYAPSTDIAVGAAADYDVLLDGANIAAGVARASATNGMAAVAIGDLGKPIYELLGKTVSNKLPEYDLVLTSDAEPTGAGTVEVQVEYAFPV